MGFRDRGIQVKTPEQVDLMRRAGLVVGGTLELLREHVRPGMTTKQLDTLAETAIRDAGATPSFLGYHGFPATLCVSVNDAVVHGIPDDREIGDGDVVSIDCGAIVEGWHGDAAVTVAVGEVDPAVSRLLQVTEDAMWAGIAAARVGGRVGDISAAVEHHVRGAGTYGLLEDYTGHGIGTEMHQAPDVPNLGRAGKGPKLVEGIALAVEPMVTLGSADVDVLDDDWTVVTRDGSVGAHFENTFALTPEGIWVLTALDGGQGRLAALGAPYGGR